MSDISPRLELPYLQPSQAQKHVTHNEALQRLDALVQMTVLGMGAETPPTAPAPGDMYALGPTPVLDWAGQPDLLALWTGTAWQFIAAQQGWRVYDHASGGAFVFDGAAWQPDLPLLQNLDQVGIATTADDVNRLAVASQASLFSHAGAGHQVKVNKAGAGDTASLLFQSNWTGHAEMGLAGDTAFSIKVSDNGTSWTEALRLDPAALELDVPVTGTAVQADALDDTPGRLLPVNAFGLGATDGIQTRLDTGDGPLPTGFYSGAGSNADNATFPHPNCRYNPFLTLNRRVSEGSYSIKRIFFQQNTPIVWGSADTGASWGDPNRLYGTANLLDAVEMTSGVPSGGVIERGSNTNGDYVRFADGTQICQITRSVSVSTTPIGALHRSTVDFGTWVYPAAFSDAPHVQANIQADAEWCSAGASSAVSAAGVTVFAAQALAAQSRTITTLAVGRWV